MPKQVRWDDIQAGLLRLGPYQRVLRIPLAVSLSAGRHWTMCHRR
jgi:hypothetical protein